MKHDFHLQHTDTPPYFEAIDTVTVGCPLCCRPIRFIAPRELVDQSQEIDFYKREISRLRYELNKLEALQRVAAMLPPDLAKEAEEAERRRAAALWNIYMGRA